MQKQIQGYPNYFITDDGKVWSEKRKWIYARNGYSKPKQQFLKQTLDGRGYYNVFLWNDCDIKGKRHRIHRIVALTFIPNPHGYLEVNHKNGIKTDNRVDNLEWTTRKGNMSHASKNGLYKPFLSLTKDQMKYIFKLKKDGIKIPAISQITGINRGNISRILRGVEVCETYKRWRDEITNDLSGNVQTPT